MLEGFSPPAVRCAAASSAAIGPPPAPPPPRTASHNRRLSRARHPDPGSLPERRRRLQAAATALCLRRRPSGDDASSKTCAPCPPRSQLPTGALAAGRLPAVRRQPLGRARRRSTPTWPPRGCHLTSSSPPPGRHLSPGLTWPALLSRVRGLPQCCGPQLSAAFLFRIKNKIQKSNSFVISCV